VGAVARSPEVTTRAPHFGSNDGWGTVHDLTGEVSAYDARQDGVGKTAQYAGDVAWVNARGFDFYEHFPGVDRWYGNVTDTKIRHVAVLFYVDGFHGYRVNTIALLKSDEKAGETPWDVVDLEVADCGWRFHRGWWYKPRLTGECCGTSNTVACSEGSRQRREIVLSVLLTSTSGTALPLTGS
jgi:hypothetical protein